MPKFKTHFVTGLAVGGTYGAVGCYLGIPLQDSLIASGSFAVASVLPDIDTDSVPLKELASFLGACVGIIAALYAQTYKYAPENLLMIGAASYFVVRYCIIGMFVRFAIHRGIFHSILMALFLSELGYVLFSGECFYKSIAIFLGYTTHLVADEVCSFRKESAGTALKLWGQNWIVNMVVITAIVVMGVIIGARTWNL